MKYHGQLNRPSDICCLTASKHHVRALSVSNEATVISRVLRQIIIIQRTRSVRGACLCECVYVATEQLTTVGDEMGVGAVASLIISLPGALYSFSSFSFRGEGAASK